VGISEIEPVLGEANMTVLIELKDWFFSAKHHHP
jgi:hypothetical protein